jgi:exopolysaccharide production protein ExoZ
MIVGALIAPSLLNVPLGGVRHVVLSLLFIPDWRPDMSIVRPVFALGWTLNYEMLFYLCFAGALMLPRRLGVAALTMGFLAMTLLGAWLRVTQTQIAFWTDPIVLEFVLGIFIALVYRGPWRAGAGLALALAGAGLLLGVGQPMAWLGFDNLPRPLEFGRPAVLIVAGAALGPAWRAGRITWAMIALGDASYALYLCHPFAVRLLRVAWRDAVGAVAPVSVYIVVCLAASIVCAILIHQFIERPVTAFLQGRLDRRKSAPPWRPVVNSEAGPRRVGL